MPSAVWNAFVVKAGVSMGGPICWSCGVQAVTSSMAANRTMARPDMISGRLRLTARQLEKDVFEIGFDSGKIDDLEMRGAYRIEDGAHLRHARPVMQLEATRSGEDRIEIRESGRCFG